MGISKDIEEYIENNQKYSIKLLKELAVIPAPSNHEEKRAEFCKKWLEEQGAEGVFIDDALNVIYPINCSDDNPLIVFMAHSDVVFPDSVSLPIYEDESRIYCPGIGDDTANVVVILMAAKYIAENNIVPKNHGILLIINSGEEGLGNLKGSRKIVEDYGDRIIDFDIISTKNVVTKYEKYIKNFYRKNINILNNGILLHKDIAILKKILTLP